MAKRERIEDLGRVSEKLNCACESLRELGSLIKVLKPAADIEDLRGVESIIESISTNVSDAWYLARFGDDEDDIDCIFGDTRNFE